MALSGQQRRRSALAAVVTVGGVLVIWAMSSMRQQSQTAELSRHWVGEQWDVARNCLVGTPIGRGGSEEELAATLEERLLRTLAEASESPAPPDPDVLWPARCVPALASLRVDRSILERDPGDALATLEVLLPRVIRVGPDGPAMLALGDAAVRARELAAAIAQLDEAMPPGAEYDPADYADDAPALASAAIVRSLGCPHPPPMRRPFFEARVGESWLFDELEVGERSLRLSADAPEGPYQLAEASASGTEIREVSGGAHPRFWDADTLLWLDGSNARRAPIDGEGAETIALGLESPTAMALCRSGAGAHLFVQHGEGARWLRVSGDEVARAVDVRPTPPRSGPLLACDEDLAVVAWTDDEGRWTGSLCRADACRALPRLEAGGDLQIAARAGRVLAVARGRRTDLPLARALLDDEEPTWGPPTAVARGRLGAGEDGFTIDACAGSRLVSADGRSWTER